MTEQWRPFSEPLRATLTRTIALALLFGAVLAQRWGRLSHWPIASLLMLWPTLGGHFIELWFLNWLRPRITESRGTQIAARLATWFVGGTVLGLGMAATAILGNLRLTSWPPWWFGGVAFIGIELVAQLGLQMRGRPSFYNARG
jgi:hypothetical protein